MAKKDKKRAKMGQQMVGEVATNPNADDYIRSIPSPVIAPNKSNEEPPNNEQIADKASDTNNESRLAKRKKNKKRKKLKFDDQSGNGGQQQKQGQKEVAKRFPLGDNCFAQISNCDGYDYLDIRNDYKDNNEEVKPLRTGIAMTLKQWEMLKNAIPDIDSAFKSDKN